MHPCAIDVFRCVEIMNMLGTMLMSKLHQLPFPKTENNGQQQIAALKLALSTQAGASNFWLMPKQEWHNYNGHSQFNE